VPRCGLLTLHVCQEEYSMRLSMPDLPHESLSRTYGLRTNILCSYGLSFKFLDRLVFVAIIDGRVN
jgi:hypothetical protein